MFTKCIPLFFFCTQLLCFDPHFTIIVPSYNNEKWVTDNIRSVALQTYTNWSLYYIDDCSTDTTAACAQNLIKEFGIESKATIIRNQKRQGALANLYHVIHQCAPTDIIVTLDGDDRLAGDDVLAHLRNAYSDSEIWMTYGNFVSDPPGKNLTRCEPIPKRIIKKNAYRKYKWVSSHLRTFYAKLFQQIKKEDLLWKGQFFPTTWDLAIMFPMLEMASKNHFLFISKVLYIYNVQNPIMDCKINRKLQLALNAHIRKKNPYKPLERLF